MPLPGGRRLAVGAAGRTGTCTIPVAALLLLACLAAAPPPAAGFLGNLPCSAQLLGPNGGCNGIDLSLDVQLEEPFDPLPSFCVAACVAGASAGACPGTEIGDTIVETCGVGKCLQQSFSICREEPCGQACANALATEDCQANALKMAEVGLSSSVLGPSSPVCVGNFCAQEVNSACGITEKLEGNLTTLPDSICSQECGNAVVSPACLATPEKVPESLSQIAGPDSPACQAQGCIQSVAAACGNLSTIEVADAVQYCSQECEDAFTSPQCSIVSAYVDAAVNYGPAGLLCRAEACANSITTSCGNLSEESIPATAAGTLLKVCSNECEAALASEDCLNIDVSAVEPYVGPESGLCLTAQCTVALGVVCGVGADSLLDDLMSADNDSVCSSACKTIIQTLPSCQQAGVLQAHDEYCDCVPKLNSTCGLDLTAGGQAWNEVVSAGAFCSPECQTLLDDGACGALLPETLEPLQGYYCSCGVSLVQNCDSLVSEPFSEPCCATALSEECRLPDLPPVEAVANSQLIGALLQLATSEVVDTITQMAGAPKVSNVLEDIQAIVNNCADDSLDQDPVTDPNGLIVEVQEDSRGSAAATLSASTFVAAALLGLLLL